MKAELRLGAWPLPDGCRFRVWAPDADRVGVRLDGGGRVRPLDREAGGFWVGELDGVVPGDRYWFSVDGRDLADPASRSQPEGTGGPSAVVEPEFAWSDDGWAPPDLDRWVLYEIHTGTFTAAGTFEGIIAQLDRLASLGVTALEIMPIAEFPGPRNWGYDGVFPFAAQSSYGGPDGLRRLVDAAHARGLAVVLDVVHNHLGPEGNVLDAFGPYHSSRYETRWGRGLNFDGPGSDEVRELFVESALWWVTWCHVDGLRLDAIRSIADTSAVPFVEELGVAVHDRADELGRPVTVIAESLANDSRVLVSHEQGGMGLDAQWCDDLHHALHVVLTGERHGYYRDFEGVVDVAESLAHGFAYRGRRSAWWGRRHGRALPAVRPSRLVVYSQNHDQVGNRPRGDRLAAALSVEKLQVAAVVTLLSPGIPLLFMGEEYAEPAPFPFFTSFSEERLATAVRRGRAHELATFGFAESPIDPSSVDCFDAAVIDPGLAGQGRHRRLAHLYRELLRLRREIPALGAHDAPEVEVVGNAVFLRREAAGRTTIVAANLGAEPSSVTLDEPTWTLALDTGEASWSEAIEGRVVDAGSLPLAPWSAVVLVGPAPA